ncbi:hypothetical protein [Nisaea sediminum]|uniref:hypothetical protein n=1 Tax=Nisaea sediminum TaxID=2775867 RepID=UPI001866CA67|nr:hypothetical protein [Nisaea sediminum]
MGTHTQAVCARSSRCRIVLSSLRLVLVTSLLAGCASPHLHDPAREKQTTAAAEAFGKIDTKTILDTERAFLAELKSKTDKVVVERVLAARDAVLMEWIAGFEEPGKQSLLSWDLMGTYIASRSEQLVGSAATFDNLKVLSAADFRRQIVNAERRLFTAQSQVNLMAANFLRAGGQGKDICKSLDNPDMSKVPESKKAEANGAIILLRSYCPSLKKAKEEWEALAEVSNLDTVKSGDISEANARIESTKTLLKVQSGIAKAAADELKKRKAHYECLLKAAETSSGLETEIANAQSLIAAFMDFLEGKPLPEEKKAETDKEEADKEKEESKAPKCEKPDLALPTLEKLAEKAGIDTGTLNDARKGLDGVLEFAAIKDDAFKTAISEFRSGTALELFEAIADPSKTPDDKNAKILLTVFRAVMKIQEIAAESDPASNADIALVSYAYQQFKADTAKFSETALKKLLALYNLRRDALVREVVHLKRAKELLAKIPEEAGNYDALVTKSPNSTSARNAVYGLTELKESWDVGRLPDQLSRYRELQIVRERNLELDGAAFAARVDLLRPIVSQLKVYGESGIKTADIARLVQAVGLIVTAYGVND